MAYSLDKLKMVVLETCYRCNGSGVFPSYIQGGSPSPGDVTCSVCNQEYVVDGVSKIVTKEIWEVD